MAYTLSASGRKSDVIGQLRQQAGAQIAGLQSQGERDNLTASLDDAEKMVEAHAGDTDSVSVSISGHISQNDTALGMQKQIGVSISRGAAGSVPVPANTGSEVDASASGAAATREPRI